MRIAILPVIPGRRKAASPESTATKGSARRPYLFFHPPRRPGCPPVDFGAGPNSGPDCRESVGWMIRLFPPNGFAGSARVSR